ncbi:Uu.00g143930.m01.CDS01 [Anthostomella pinea]|uniref:Uu.00g143930.m01.CDS01 n=1 Tax=Anthostomella pinea TaxID=933095 RepID=A0AAI8VQS5_9PEZI|nr:Uu.00g143930.m01.CDS01 [Anthostomella pinea]
MFRRTALLALAALLPSSLAQVSEDFESGWDQTAWPTYAPDCNQGGTVTLDSTKAHSGTNSIRVNGAGGFCGHIFFGTTAVPTGDVYVRVYLQAQTALTSSHVSFITMPDSNQGTDKHLRIGGQSGILMYNRESDDATLPALSPNGIAASEALPTGTWECFEYHLSTNGSIETWLNGDAIAGLTSIKGVTNEYNTQWQSNTEIPSVTGIYFGWESYGGDVNTFWYDDIAVASTRVGCL